jgi:LEA14-like dessication related protein
MIRHRSLALIAVASLALSGCQTLLKQAFASPVVQVRDVRVKNIGLNGGTIDVVLDVENPNEYRIDAEKISYNFFVDTTRVVTGELAQLMTLESSGKTTITVPVSFDYNAVSVAMRQYLAKGALDYRVEGFFTLVTPVGRLTRPYSGTGRVAGMP